MGVREQLACAIGTELMSMRLMQAPVAFDITAILNEQIERLTADNVQLRATLDAMQTRLLAHWAHVRDEDGMLAA